MPQSLARVILHTVFSTKDRFPFLQNPAFRAEVHAYLGGCAKSLDCLPIQIGGVADHVHLLTTLPRTLTIADFIKEVKRVSTNWIHERGEECTKFHWQAGNIYHVSQTIHLPFNGATGLNFVPDSGYIEYPIGTTPRPFSAATNNALIAQALTGTMTMSLNQIDPSNLAQIKVFQAPDWVPTAPGGLFSDGRCAAIVIW